MTHTEHSHLYVTVYDRAMASLGGAAWVDRKIRDASEAPTNTIKDFLVSDDSARNFVELELRGRRLSQIRTLWRMVTLGEPYIVAKFRQSPSWKRRMAELNSAWGGEVVVTSQWPALLLARDAEVPVALHIAHNVDYRLSEIYDPPLFRVLRNSRRTKRFELKALSHPTRVVALSATDQTLLANHGRNAMHLTLAPSATRPRNGGLRNAVGFIGKAGWPPNAVALRALQEEIMPKLRERMGLAAPTLVVAGRGTEDVADNQTICLGTIDSVEDFYERVDVVVVPRGDASSGISVKILEAWENGVHVIAPANLLRAIGVSEIGSADSNDKISEELSQYFEMADHPPTTAGGGRPRGDSLRVADLWRTLLDGSNSA